MPLMGIGCRWGALSLLACLLSVLATAQQAMPSDSATNAESPSLHLHPLSRDYLTSYLTDSRDMLLAPWHFDRRSRRLTGLAVGAVGLAMWFDGDLHSGLSFSARQERLAGYTNPLGNGLLLLPLSGLLWLEGYRKSDAHWQLTGLNLAKAGISARILVQLPKYLFQRQRPLESPDNPFVFEGPFGSYRHNSFPSGHVATAFATAAVMHRAFGEDHVWVPVVFYGLGLASATGRIVQQKHWLSDVLFAAIIGQCVGDFVSRRGSTRFEVNGAGVAYKL